MKASKSGTTITIIIDSQFEADILASCLNWGVSAMAKSKLIDTAKDDDTTRERCKIENAMWEEFCKVNIYRGDTGR